MPESERPERSRQIERALERLGAAVERAGVEVEAARRRASAAESRAGELEEALAAAEAGAGGDEGTARSTDLVAENRRLREVLGEARERAKRLRARLAMVEDEV